MNKLPDEILEEIFLFIENKRILRLVNRRFAYIVDILIFHTPTWKIRPFIQDISHLPIKILKTSQISNYDRIGEKVAPLEHLPLELTYFILDSVFTEIAPSVILAHPQTTFLISIHYLNNCRYHKSHFLYPNVKLFTTAPCYNNWDILRTYKDFTFATLTISHIETWPHTKPDILEILSGLKIERLILDKAEEPLDPTDLLKFENIVHFSSRIFKQGKLFPLFLVSKLPKLESFHCKRQTSLNIGEFKQLRKKSVDYLLYYRCAKTNWPWNDLTLSRVFRDAKDDNVYCHHSILVHLKNIPKHLLSLQSNLL